jgi:hypothetical protein
MIKFLALIPLLFWSVVHDAQAQNLTPAQLATVCTACKAAPACDALRVSGQAADLLGWLNAVRTPETLAWYKSAPVEMIESAPSYTTYDSLTQGKRDSWLVLLHNPRDFTRVVIRNWVVDVWGNATANSNAEKVLQAATFPASNVQNALGGTLRTTGTVSALALTFFGSANQDDANVVANPVSCQ